MKFSEYLAQQTQAIDAELQRLAPPETTLPETIHRAMRYSLMAGGKRIRPILCLEAARCVSDNAEGAITLRVRWNSSTPTRSFMTICPLSTTMITGAAS